MIKEKILKHRIIAIIRGNHLPHIEKIAEALLEGGICIVEITMNSPHVLDMLDILHKRFSDDLILGSGTVTSVEQIHAVHQRGSRFIVSPDTHPEVIQAALSYGVEPLPGALTPTEILAAKRAGARFVKIFPAETFGPTYLHQIMTPIDDLYFVPTGGIDLENALLYLRAGAAALGIGGALVPRDFDGTLSEAAVITRHARAFADLVK